MKKITKIKSYKDGGKTGAQLKAEGIALKKKGLKIKAEGQKMKPGNMVKRFTEQTGTGFYPRETTTTAKIDTTGYAKGKKVFPVKVASKTKFLDKPKSKSYGTGTISRKGVEKFFKKGGKKC